MSLIVIGRSTLPTPARGAKGAMTVAVRENGQIGFSTSAAKVFDNHTHCLVGWDGEGRLMVFTPVNLDKLPKGVKKEEAFVVGQSKNADRYISAAGLFRHEAINYDYKTAGTHSFPAENGNGKLSFTLPVKMDPKPKQERKPRAKKAVAGATVTQAASPASGEPVLQEA